MESILCFLMGYLLGSFPTGYVLSKLKGVNIRELGSGNIGAINVYRVLGARYAVLVGIVDVLKGFIPVILAPTYTSSLLAGIGSLLGSVFSLFLGFRGGKGFATLVGVWLAISLRWGHWEVPLVVAVPWVTALALTGYTSLSNLLAVTTLVPVVAFTHRPELLLFAVFSVALIVFSHRDNVRRLVEGSEHRVTERVRGRVRW